MTEGYTDEELDAGMLEHYEPAYSTIAATVRRLRRERDDARQVARTLADVAMYAQCLSPGAFSAMATALAYPGAK